MHCYNQNGLCAIAFTDDHYPVRSAFSLLNTVTNPYMASSNSIQPSYYAYDSPCIVILIDPLNST